LIELDYETDDLIHTEYVTEEEGQEALRSSPYKGYLIKGTLVNFDV
jgi:hypothetical protein